jgi:hypothetical protein
MDLAKLYKYVNSLPDLKNAEIINIITVTKTDDGSIAETYVGDWLKDLQAEVNNELYLSKGAV